MHVELLDSMGSDIDVVNAARVTMDRWSHELSVADKGVIRYMIQNRHGTPFEMVQLKFRITVPIFVAREWMRHRIGSYNEMSSRYVKMDKGYFVPSYWRQQVGKRGHYQFIGLKGWRRWLSQIVYRSSVYVADAAYSSLLRIGLAKEVARNVLPLNTMTSFVWSVNLRSLFNFIKLRTDETALYEIRRAAYMVREHAYNVAPYCMEQWELHDRPVV